MLLQEAPLAVSTVADTVRLALTPVFLLTGIGAVLNVTAARLSRIVDRSRDLEALILATRGSEHERWLGELRIVDRRMKLVSNAITLGVLAGVLTCLVVVLLFSAQLTHIEIAVPIALLFIGAMVTVSAALGVFLIETRLGARAVQVPQALLEHPDPGA